MYRMANISY